MFVVHIQSLAFTLGDFYRQFTSMLSMYVWGSMFSNLKMCLIFQFFFFFQNTDE